MSAHKSTQMKQVLLGWGGRLALSLAVALSMLGSAHATKKMIDAVPTDGRKVRLDGMLREWPKLTVLSEQVAGRKAGGDPRVLGTVGYDDKNLYVVMRVKDAKFIRTAAMGTKEDHAVLRIAFPAGRGFKSYQVRLYPGVPGKSPGAVKLAGVGKVRGAKIVEAPAKDGFTFEASIPWGAFPEARRVRGGLRGALLFYDADTRGKVATVVGTSKKSGRSAPPLTLQSEYSLNRALVFKKGLDVKADRELFGDVVGDRMHERIAVYGRYLTVTGWNYRGGKEFYYQDLQLMKRGDLKRFELRDLTGDGHQDLVLRRRVGTTGSAKEYLEVWHFRASDDGPQLVFQHEVGAVSGLASVANKVSIKRARGKHRITVSQGEHAKLSPGEWDVKQGGGDTLPMLMPWQKIKSKSYEWKSTKFEEVDEESWKPKISPPKRGTRMWSGSEAPAGLTEESSADAPLPPRPPTAEELMDKVYALYRADHGARRSKPRFDFVTNVSSDPTPERVLIHGKDIVVFGKKFKNGSSYVYTTVGVKKPNDILDVTARDMTGDGRAEVIVRGLISAKASKQLGGGVVARHALFIYKVGQNEVRRIFAAETGRSLDGNSILGHVRFIPEGKGLMIQLKPGRSVRWDEENYPFPQDRLPYGGLEPLLLPWSDMPARSYRYEGLSYKQL